jgi:hypothetical protein
MERVEDQYGSCRLWWWEIYNAKVMYVLYILHGEEEGVFTRYWYGNTVGDVMRSTMQIFRWSYGVSYSSILSYFVFSYDISVINLISSFVFPLYVWYISSVFMWLPLLVMCVVRVVWKQAHFWDTPFKWPVTVNQSMSHCESPNVTAISQYESLSVTVVRVSVSPWV